MNLSAVGSAKMGKQEVHRVFLLVAIANTEVDISQQMGIELNWLWIIRQSFMLIKLSHSLLL
jgi:hypothetical protein